MTMSSSDDSLLVAAYQPDCRSASPPHQLDRLREHLTCEARANYDIIVCPELFLSGYFAGDTLRDYAEPPGGPFMCEVQELAANAQCAVVYGFPERAEDAIYNACAFVDAGGELLAVHRKSVLPHEYEHHYFSPGGAPTIVTYRGWRLGVLICYEAEFPEYVRHCAVQGCDLVLVPTALSTEFSLVARQLIPTRAFENNLFITYANYCGNAGSTEFAGDSVIVGPYARAGSSEGVISARPDGQQIHNARQRLRFLADLDNLRLGH